MTTTINHHTHPHPRARMLARRERALNHAILLIFAVVFVPFCAYDLWMILVEGWVLS